MLTLTRPAARADRQGMSLYTESQRMQEYENLKRLVEAAADDVAKAEGGNKAAGTRVRKSMQEIKNAAQEVRKKILEVRSSEQQ
jgi:hypothetical protein